MSDLTNEDREALASAASAVVFEGPIDAEEAVNLDRALRRIGANEYPDWKDALDFLFGAGGLLVNHEASS